MSETFDTICDEFLRALNQKDATSVLMCGRKLWPYLSDPLCLDIDFFEQLTPESRGVVFLGFLHDAIAWAVKEKADS